MASLETAIETGERRSRMIVRKGRLGDRKLEGAITQTSSEERLGMVWPLTVQAWAFLGEDIAQSRLPRHVVSVTLRKR